MNFEDINEHTMQAFVHRCLTDPKADPRTKFDLLYNLIESRKNRYPKYWEMIKIFKKTIDARESREKENYNRLLRTVSAFLPFRKIL